jgi:hypothetical protein
MPDADPHPSSKTNHEIGELRARWIDRYGPYVAAQLEADRRYSLVRVAQTEFAYTTYDLYTRALAQLWDSGLVPEPLPSTKGSELLDVAPNLQAVDLDPDELGTPERETG